MKSFVSASFFLVFEQIVRQGNPNLSLDRWRGHGVEWERSRHSFASRIYSHALDVYTATHDEKDAWQLIVVKEQWWAGRKGEIAKVQQWARPLHGKPAVILAWFAARKRALGA
ncbi:MAG TPA: hypothetical protein VMD53_09025 [Rhizomicrobium sp.]|nr:hypothetical protein [Rhizomicrobium sp.]